MEYDHLSVKQFRPFLIPRKIILLPCTYWLFKSIVVRSTAALRLGLSLQRWASLMLGESAILVDQHNEPGRSKTSVMFSELADVLQISPAMHHRYKQYNTSLLELPEKRVGHFAAGILWSDLRCALHHNDAIYDAGWTFEDRLHIHFLDCRCCCSHSRQSKMRCTYVMHLIASDCCSPLVLYRIVR